MPFCLFNHPFVFAAVAIAAIGIVVYELIEENKRRQPVAVRRPPANNRPGSSPDNRPRPPPNNPPRPPSDSDDFKKSPPDNRPSPPPNNPPRPPSDSFHSDSDDFKKSPPDNRPRPPPNNPPPGNSLRRRNINRTASKENAQEIFIESENQEDSDSAVRVISKSSIRYLRQTSSNASNQNSHDKKFDENNYCKNMLDKLTNDTKNVIENIKDEKVSGHNIYDEESDSSENNLLPKGEEKVINQAIADKKVGNHKKPYKRKRKTKSNMEKTAKNHTDKRHDTCFESSDHYENESSSDSQSGNSSTFIPVKVTKESPIQQRHSSKNASDRNSGLQSSNLYPKLDIDPLSNVKSEFGGSSLSSDEDTYKKDVLKAFKNDLQNCEVISNADSSDTYSSIDIEEVESPDSKSCKGCEENNINTRAYPCNHAYLCVDCAARVFRLFKKCAICLQDVKEFVQFAL